MHAIQGRVRGRVQGVFYRASFQREAAARGLTGWVRNHADGSVEFRLQGEPKTIEQVVDWARRGPPAARVETVEVDEVAPDPGLQDFRIR